MSVLVAQLGARRHYAVARAFNTVGCLDRLVTDICADTAPWRWLRGVVPDQALPVALKRLLARHAPGLPVHLINNLPQLVLSADYRTRAGEATTDFWARRNAAFGHAMVKSGFGQADSVYAYNGAALEIFSAAKQRGLATVLDQTAAPWRYNRELLKGELRDWPGWQDGSSEIDTSGALAAREEREWQLADAIVCGSAFARDGLAQTGGPADRCRVVAYSGHAAMPVHSGGPSQRGGGLRVVFVGTLQLRKGVQYLLQAKRLLKTQRLEFRLVGPSQLSAGAVAELAGEMDVAGPVARNEVQRHYGWADVLVLPTLSEGSANVVYEAMAAGVPVITTANAGSIIRHDEDGIIVPARDPEALAQAIERLVDDRELRAALAQAAQRSLARFDLKYYAHALIGALPVALPARKVRAA